MDYYDGFFGLCGYRTSGDIDNEILRNYCIHKAKAKEDPTFKLENSSHYDATKKLCRFHLIALLYCASNFLKSHMRNFTI